MKFLFIYLQFFLFFSCSTVHENRRIASASMDFFAEESFFRWSDERLDGVKNNAVRVLDCYQGRSSDVLKTYSTSYSSEVNNPFYWIHVGNCFFMKNLFLKAEFFYRMALADAKLDRVKSVASNNLGLIYLKYRLWEKAREYFHQSISLGKNYKIPFFNLSQLYIQFGLYDKAIELLTSPIFRDHKDVDILHSLANIYLFKGEYEISNRYFKMIPSEYFQREDIAASYSIYLIAIKNFSKASAVMEARKRSHVHELTLISQKIQDLLSKKTIRNVP
jgi:tetratricopeptide (TPR) repeat protein